jgi:putative transposase
VELEDTQIRSRKIRIYPNKEQRDCFKFFFAGSRAAFNITNEYLKQPGTKANWKGIKTDLIKELEIKKPWLSKVPYQIRSLAIKENCDAVKAAKKKFLLTGEYQDVSYKKFNSKHQSCYIPKQAIKNNAIYVDCVSEYISKSTQTKKDKKQSVLEIAEKFPDNFGDSRLVLENGRWYICVSYEVILDPQSNASSIADVKNQDNRIVALDPGIRSFMTFYSLDSCGKLGEGAFAEIQNLGLKLDKLISIKKKTSSKLRFKRRNQQNAINRIRNRIKDLVMEMHHKVALFLVRNFDTILLPKFETKEMANKNIRKIGRKTVRNMMTFSFYKFSMILKDKAKKYGKVVIDITEEYTSKTVSWNGEIKNNLGSARWITSGNITVDRDYNGARGVFLKWLSQGEAIMEDFSSLGRSPYSGIDAKTIISLMLISGIALQFQLEYKSATSDELESVRF